MSLPSQLILPTMTVKLPNNPLHKRTYQNNALGTIPVLERADTYQSGT